MKTRTIQDSQPTKDIILPSPGFALKELSTWHVDLVRRCAAMCGYCSTNSGTSTRIQRRRLKVLALEQLGEAIDPTQTPDVAIVWDPAEVLRRLEAQLAGKPPTWGEGETLVVSMLTDAFLGQPFLSGLTMQVLGILLTRTKFRLRILTKSSLVARADLLALWKLYPGRVVVGLSVGTLDDAWASNDATGAERGASTPSARLRALAKLQDAGVATFGMACPLFPHVLDGELEILLEKMRPALVERIWFEPFNQRGKADTVAATYPEGSRWRGWFDRAFGAGHDPVLWSHYATELYLRTRAKADVEGWTAKLAYLLYEGQITEADAKRFPDLRGVLLLGPTDDAGQSTHPVFARMQAVARAA